MSEPWKAGDEVYKTIQHLIANHFPDLVLVEDEILVVFKEKASKNNNKAIPGKTSKANSLLSVVDETADWKFVITLAADEWQAMGNKDREALIFHHLCACGVEENVQSGNVKYFIKIPDVSFYRKEVEEYGFWRTSGETPEPDLIDELFGAESTPAP